uniref:SH3 domain protein n=1 Tax=Musca domestica TaxID=7370 RepID=T1PK66_MUSDO
MNTQSKGYRGEEIYDNLPCDGWMNMNAMRNMNISNNFPPIGTFSLETALGTPQTPQPPPQHHQSHQQQQQQQQNHQSQHHNLQQQQLQQQQKQTKQNLRIYRALYDYEAQDVDEVSFREGDIIFEVESIDSGWMTGRVERTGKTGMLPANYVEQAVI